MEKVKRTRRTKKQMEEARAAAEPKPKKPKYLSKERRSFEVSHEEFARLRGLS